MARGPFGDDSRSPVLLSLRDDEETGLDAAKDREQDNGQGNGQFNQQLSTVTHQTATYSPMTVMVSFDAELAMPERKSVDESRRPGEK